MRSETVTPLPDLPKLRCLHCGETDRIDVSFGVGTAAVSCQVCKRMSFIQDPQEDSDR